MTTTAQNTYTLPQLQESAKVIFNTVNEYADIAEAKTEFSESLDSLNLSPEQRLAVIFLAKSLFPIAQAKIFIEECACITEEENADAKKYVESLFYAEQQKASILIKERSDIATKEKELARLKAQEEAEPWFNKIDSDKLDRQSLYLINGLDCEIAQSDFLKRAEGMVTIPAYSCFFEALVYIIDNHGDDFHTFFNPELSGTNKALERARNYTKSYSSIITTLLKKFTAHMDVVNKKFETSYIITNCTFSENLSLMISYQGIAYTHVDAYAQVKTVDVLSGKEFSHTLKLSAYQSAKDIKLTAESLIKAFDDAYKAEEEKTFTEAIAEKKAAASAGRVKPKPVNERIAEAKEEGRKAALEELKEATNPDNPEGLTLEQAKRAKSSGEKKAEIYRSKAEKASNPALKKAYEDKAEIYEGLAVKADIVIESIEDFEEAKQKAAEDLPELEKTITELAGTTESAPSTESEQDNANTDETQQEAVQS